MSAKNDCCWFAGIYAGSLIVFAFRHVSAAICFTAALMGLRAAALSRGCLQREPGFSNSYVRVRSIRRNSGYESHSSSSSFWVLLVFELRWPRATRPGADPKRAQASASTIAVGPQYDTTHVYVSPEKVDAFVKAFLGTFGGTSTKQAVVTVTPTLKQYGKLPSFCRLR